MVDLFKELGDALRPSVIEPLKLTVLSSPQLTEEEIKVLIRHYVGVLRMNEELSLTGQLDSSLIRQSKSVNSRINYYSQFVSETDVQAIFLDVYEGFDEWAKKTIKEQTDTF